MKKLKKAIWFALALILAIIVIGAPAAHYCAEALYDLRPRFLIEMFLVPLFLLLASMQGTLYLVKKANIGSRHEGSKIGLLILVLWAALMIGSAIIAHSIAGSYPILSRMLLPLASVLTGILLAVTLNVVE